MMQTLNEYVLGDIFTTHFTIAKAIERGDAVWVFDDVDGWVKTKHLMTFVPPQRYAIQEARPEGEPIG